MSGITTTEALVLGMLIEADMSAYDLAKFVRRGLSDVWPRAKRQLFNVPKTLLASGLVSARSEAVGRRGRTVYSISQEGRTALADWLATRTAPPALEFEAMVRIVLSNYGTPEALSATLDALIEDARVSRTMFQEHRVFMEATGGSFPDSKRQLMAANTFMLGHYDHIIEWAENTRREFSEGSRGSESVEKTIPG